MSLGNQMRALGRQAAAFRQDLFGTKDDGTPVTADYNHGEFPALRGYYSPIRYRQFTDDSGGYLEIRAAVFRVIKASYPSFTPAIDKHLTITEGETEIILRIDEILGTHPLSVEWVLISKEQN